MPNIRLENKILMLNFLRRCTFYVFGLLRECEFLFLKHIRFCYVVGSLHMLLPSVDVYRMDWILSLSHVPPPNVRGPYWFHCWTELIRFCDLDPICKVTGGQTMLKKWPDCTIFPERNGYVETKLAIALKSFGEGVKLIWFWWLWPFFQDQMLIHSLNGVIA